jgi:hypothetical protein
MKITKQFCDPPHCYEELREWVRRDKVAKRAQERAAKRGEINLTNHVIVWNRNGSVRVAPWPDVGGKGRGFLHSCGACDAEVRNLNRAERIDFLNDLAI